MKKRFLFTLFVALSVAANAATLYAEPVTDAETSVEDENAESYTENDSDENADENEDADENGENAEIIEAIPSDVRPPEITADAAILTDVYTGAVIYEKNIDALEYPASITKIMTAMLALEKGDPSDIITVSETAVDIEYGSSNVGLKEGEKITLEQALYALMLESANEAANAIAEHIGGSVNEFCHMMNDRAKELGCKSTNFVNPHGLHDANHYTTARDMALISRQAYKTPGFLDILKTMSYTIPETNLTDEPRNLYTHNQMIKEPSKYVYEGCLGGKTGYTDQAQNTLVTYAQKDGMELMAIVLKNKGAESYVNSAKLYDYGFDNFKREIVFNETTFSSKRTVTQRYKDKELEAGELEIKADNGLVMTLPINFDKSEIKTDISYNTESFYAPIEKGTIFGKAVVSYNGKVIGSSNLSAANAVNELTDDEIRAIETASLKESLGKIKKPILAMTGLVIIFAGALALFMKKKRKRRKRQPKINYRTYDSSSYGNNARRRRASQNNYNFDLRPRRKRRRY